jgi:Protein of unknown function (DUF2809)
MASVAHFGRRRREETMSDFDARVKYAGWTVVIVLVGLLCRWPALGLPWPVAKYAGSTLWGAMVYLAMRAIAPRPRPSTSLTIACALAISVELFRLYRTPELDAFRSTLAGKLLLGRVFSPWNMVAYVAGIISVAFVEAVATGEGRRHRKELSPGRMGEDRKRSLTSRLSRFSL